jgi:rod shape-determining protein MreB
MRDGVIADYTITEAMLSYFIDKACGRSRFFKPEVMICIPSGVTQVERRAVLDATMAAGARAAYLIEEPLAAAIGAKIPIAQAAGHMVVDIGGGSTEAAVISLGGVVVHNSVRVGGNKIDEAIANYIKHKFNLLVGERTSEEIKIEIGNAFLSEAEKKEPRKMEIRGRDSITGLPRTVEVTEVQINEAIQAPLLDIVNGVKKVLEDTPPELASDIIDKGIVMSGGTSLLHNLDKLMAHLTGVPSHVAEDSLLCVVRGTGVALENIELYKRSISRK